ncbi:hypothetical protein ES705_28250 [subsurface metagenome]
MPGANSLLPNSEDEQVTAELILSSPEAVVVQVADAKNISRALMLTVQLAELDVPMVLALNMWDEAKDLHIKIDHRRLAELAGIRVVRTVATERRGFTALRHGLLDARKAQLALKYPQTIEEAVKEIEVILPQELSGRRGRALMILGGASEPLDVLSGQDRQAALEIRQQAQERFGEPLSYIISQARFAYVRRLLEPLVSRAEPEGESQRSSRVVWRGVALAIMAFLVGYKLADLVLGFTAVPELLGNVYYYTLLAGPGLLCVFLYQRFVRDPFFERARSFSSLLGLLTMRVRTAIPLVIVTLWLLYVLVGKFAAGTCVDFLESVVFGQYINPGLMYVVVFVLPEESLAYQLLFDDAGENHDLDYHFLFSQARTSAEHKYPRLSARPRPTKSGPHQPRMPVSAGVTALGLLVAIPPTRVGQASYATNSTYTPAWPAALAANHAGTSAPAAPPAMPPRNTDPEESPCHADTSSDGPAAYRWTDSPRCPGSARRRRRWAQMIGPAHAAHPAAAALPAGDGELPAPPCVAPQR